MVDKGTSGAQVTPAARKVAAVIAAHPGGLALGDVDAAVRAKVPTVAAARVQGLLEEARAAGLVTVTADGVCSATDDTPETPSRAAVEHEVEDSDEARGPARAVVVDVESVVRTSEAPPFVVKRIFQVGAVRTGTDTAWAAEVPAYSRFLTLPDESWHIRSDAVRARHAEYAVPPADALTGLHEFCAGADVLVTYNGTTADVPMLREALARVGLPDLEPRHVDAHYVALALWPAEPNHRLAPLCDALKVSRDGLGWHDALDDSRLLARLLARGAAELAGWPSPLRELVLGACRDSPAWALLAELAGHPLPEESLTTEDVAAALEPHLAGRAPRRATGPPPGRGRIRVGAELRGDDGRVSPGRIAAAVRGDRARPRAAQDAMTERMLEWVDAGVPGLVEAPTGTGKSYAALAAALDWLAGDPERTAVIATYTKQLQAQLADDVSRLAGKLAGLGLLEAADVVKGARNRLSVRALAAALAAATAVGDRHRGQRNRFVVRPDFRELLVYLALRLVAAGGVEDGWVSRSVDPVDVPAFFSDYAGKVLPVWLDSLSQGANGEYGPGTERELAAHTDEVAEALASHRLILANHALLLAHADDVGRLGPQTLLVVDEAHQLEDAATSALSHELDHRALGNLHEELRTWLRSARPGPARSRLWHASDELEGVLDDAQLPRSVARFLDARLPRDAGAVGTRAATLASEYAGTAAGGLATTVAGKVRAVQAHCGMLAAALAGYLDEHPDLEFFDRERVEALQVTCRSLAANAGALVDDIDAIHGPTPVAGGAASGAETGDGDTEETDAEADGSADDGADGADPEQEMLALEGGVPDDETLAAELDANADAGTEVEAGEAPGGLPDDTSNRVVYVREDGDVRDLRPDLRWYPFTIVSSPVDLGRDAGWRGFREAFPRAYFVSATLRVAGSWDFIRGRLALGDHVQELLLESPFDAGKQARLVCLSDFPSWAEQTEGAVRTVAHQLAGYASEVVTAAASPDGAGEGSRGGSDGGALVLTTARSTAGGIAEALGRELAAREDETPVRSALVLGNRRAVDDFTDDAHGGGFLVGTRGLWQGVDVADPRRLRLVWVNKLPFAPFADPVIEARRSAVVERAHAAGAEDPDAAGTEAYYLPLAAIALRQAVGRLIRSEDHRGVVVISDRKLAGSTALRRSYRQSFLGSLDPGLLEPDPDTGEPGGGNVVPMTEGWSRIWSFLTDHALLDPARAEELSTPEALEVHTLLPHTRAIRALAMTEDDVADHRAAGTLTEEVLTRSAQVAGLLALSDEPAELKDAQRQVIGQVVAGRDVLGLLPTGYGKSYCFQLPALVLPGVTLVVSPLVALMTDQALALNRSIGGAVRALVAPMRESSSRAGKTEVADQLLGRADHGIRLVYVSPERLTQRRFQQVLGEAVAAGRVTRVAIDEAHTFVQWNDFRPSMHRVSRLLTELRREHGLAVTALTATANRSVLAGLREGLFALDGDASPEQEAAEAAAGRLVTVRENPIRPELAVFRRTIRRAGTGVSAGLAEEVAAQVADHAIFYCLTVKEVVALSAHLRDFLEGTGTRVLRFHGRLTEAEKSAVLTEFREAPSRGDEGFAPMIVVATSAFGLGIDRPDVRTVYCASTPTDLAAFYQQIGRAGRDAAGLRARDGDVVDGELAADVPGEGPTPVNVGMGLLTQRGIGLARFMTANDLSPQLLERMGRAVLASGRVLDATRVADELMGEDLESGRLRPEEATKERTSEEYTAGVVRAFAALAELGAVTDLGDFPPLVAVKPGELPRPDPTTADPTEADPTGAGGRAARVEAAVVDAVLALPWKAAGDRLRRSQLSVLGVDAHLAAAVAGYRDLAPDEAGTWQLLADLHDRGLLDVSAAPSGRPVTGLEVPDAGAGLPGGFVAAVAGKAKRANAELRALEDFFADETTCANTKLAEYFAVPVPDGCCTGPENWCSTCWHDGHRPGEKPPVAVALETRRPRPAGSRTDTATVARRLDERVHRLVYGVYRGVHLLDLFRALRGDETYFHVGTRRRRRLAPSLTSSRHFGSMPAVTKDDLDDSLGRLAAAGKVVKVGTRWRDAAHTRRQEEKAAKAAAASEGSSP